MPSEKYFEVAQTPCLTHKCVNEYGIIEAVGTGICDYSAARTIFEEHLYQFDSELMDAAEEFHDSCYLNGVHVTQSIDTRYIVATTIYRTNLPDSKQWPKTLVQMEFYEQHFLSTDIFPLYEFNKITEEISIIEKLRL